MLNGISAQELANKNLIQQSDQIQANKKKNPYADIDRNLLIDETSISKEAVNLYQKDLDIKKFTSLALSDPQDTSHNSLVANTVFNGGDESFDERIIEDIFNNKSFLRDLLA